MHRDRPPRAGLRRRHHVARDGGHVAEAPSARALGGVWPDPRSRRLFDLARLRLERALLLHGDLQVDLPRPRDAGLAGGFSGEGRARGSARAGGAAGCRKPDRRDARNPVAGSRGRARPHHGLPGRLRPDRRPRRRARRAGRGPEPGQAGARPAYRPDRRHLDLPHGARRRAAHGPGRLGPLLRRGGAGPVAERGRPVGDRSTARPHPRPARRGPGHSALPGPRRMPG